MRFATCVLAFDFWDGVKVGGGSGLVESASTVHRGYSGVHRKLSRRGGRPGEGGGSRVEVDIAVEVLELFGGHSVGILVEDFLSNDCVSLSSRNRFALPPLAALEMRSPAARGQGHRKPVPIDCLPSGYKNRRGNPFAPLLQVVSLARNCIHAATSIENRQVENLPEETWC